MTDLIDTTEMYLRTVLELEEEGITPMRARIAERLEHSGPTVSQTVARMERHGLLTVAPDRSLQLTSEGRQRAVEVMRKHRLAERLLADVIGLDLEYIHEEACRWEHVMSEDVERRVVAVLDDPARSPFGNPIPGLEGLGVHGALHDTEFGIRAVDLAEGRPVEARIVQLNEILQVDSAQFAELHDAGITVGSTVTMINDNGSVRISSGNREVEINSELAHAIRIERV